MIITSLGQRIVVRYARKPLWMPTAPSKLFRIPEHNFYSEDEVKKIKMLSMAYRAQEKSIQEFMKHEFYIPATQSGGLPAEFVAKEEELDRKLMEENDRENARIAAIKEEILGQKLKELEQKTLEAKVSKEEQLLEAAMVADQFVSEHKDNPDSFVTPNNIELMIDRAIENQVSYEFSIDRSGRQFKSVNKAKE